MIRPEKLVDLLKAAYALEADDRAWAGGVLRTAGDVWGGAALDPLLAALDQHGVAEALGGAGDVAVVNGREGPPAPCAEIEEVTRAAVYIAAAFRLRRRLACAPGGARWTLVATYECEGARYVVARENQPTVYRLPELSEREQQVVACLAFGRSTKEIAFALGVSDSTVRVLVARASARLRVRTREELLHQVIPGVYDAT
jgi:DNA-binding CsgD family transcriptional regulator